ncbi:MAG: hypothetical protein ACI935_003731, partial [Moritella dasanensis]
FDLVRLPLIDDIKGLINVHKKSKCYKTLGF